MTVSFFWISNPCARLDGWKTLKLHQLQQIMLVLFEIYIQKLIIRIESRFWSFNEGMNAITDAHIFVCASVIPFIPSLNDQNLLSVLNWTLQRINNCYLKFHEPIPCSSRDDLGFTNSACTHEQTDRKNWSEFRALAGRPSVGQLSTSVPCNNRYLETLNFSSTVSFTGLT